MDKNYAILINEDFSDDTVIDQIVNVIKDNNGEVYIFTSDQSSEKDFTVMDLKQLEKYRIINVM